MTQPIPRRLPLSRLLPTGNLAATLYGTILVTSVIATLSPKIPPGYAIAALVVTAFVFALAHSWADAMKASVDEASPLTIRHLVRTFVEEWPIVRAAFPSVLVLIPAVLGLYSVATGFWVATGCNVALLGVWGAEMRRIASGSVLQIALAALSSAGFGFLLAAMKVVVH